MKCWFRIDAYSAMPLRLRRRAFRKDPSALAGRLEKGYAYADDLPNLKGKGNPAGTYSLMKGDEQSLDILFVAVCRSLGIPARLHPSEQKPQYLCAEGWKDAIFRLNSPRNRESSSWGCRSSSGTRKARRTRRSHPMPRTFPSPAWKTVCTKHWCILMAHRCLR